MKGWINSNRRFEVIFTGGVVAGALAIYWTVSVIRSPWLTEIAKMPVSRRLPSGGVGQPSEFDVFHLRVQPVGILEREFPNAIVFHLVYADVPKGAGGLKLSAEEAKSCIRVEPPVPGELVWTSPVNLEYRFSEVLRPAEEYRVDVDCIPVTPEEKLSVRRSSYWFKTPEFGFLGADFETWTGAYLTARIHFNYPLEQIGIRDLVSVVSASGKTLPIVNLRFDSARTFEITFPNAGEEEYEVLLKKGIRAANQMWELRKTIRVPLRLSRRQIYIKNVVAQEGTRGFSLLVTCAVQGRRGCPVAVETVKSRLTITPALKTRLVPAPFGFRIIGEFLTQQTYRVRIHAGIQAEDAVLMSDYEEEVSIPFPTPRVQFPIRGKYLGKNMGVKLPLSVRTTQYIGLSIRRVPPENWVFFTEDRWGGSAYAETVVEDVVLPVEGGEKAELVWLDLANYLDTREPGIYEIEVERKEKPETKKRAREEEFEEIWGGEWEEDGYWSDEARRGMKDWMTLVITDLALIAKRGTDRVWVWALDATTLQPRSGVSVALYSQKNVQMAACVTGDAGACELRYEAIRDRVPTVVTARSGEEFSYVHLDESEVSLEPFSVSGVDPTLSNLSAYFYAERDLYRPGETIHFAVLVRERARFTAAVVPVTVEVTDPNGKVYTTLDKMTDRAGLAEFALSLPLTARTGAYLFSVKVGETELTPSRIFVEAFVPERMVVTLKTDRKDYVKQPEIGFNVSANYLYGSPASGAPVDYRCVARESVFSAKGYEEYSFGRVREGYREVPVREYKGEGTLNEKGEGSLRCVMEGMEDFYTMAEVRVGVSVEEAGSGRVSRAAQTVRYHPYDYYIGLKSETRRVSAGGTVEVEGVVLNNDGTIRTDVTQLEYQVFQRVWEYAHIWDPETNGFRWESSYQRYPTSDEGRVTIKNGRFKIAFRPTVWWMDYAVQVRDPDGRSATDLIIYGWGWYEEEKMESPEILKIRLSKNLVDSNEVITAEAMLPFEGRILWTIESEGVLEWEWQEARGEIARLRFQAPENRNTLYVSALLVRSDEQYLVRRAFGVERLSIRPSRHRLNLTLDVPRRIRPGETLRVTLRGSGSYEATVAIVDEGILQISDFASPDVYEGVLRDTALKVRTSETLGWIVPKGMLTPGGAEEGVGLKIQPALQLVSYWSGVVQSDAQGRVTVKFKVPSYLGKLRVMASAMNDRQFGSADAYVTVTTEIATVPTFPKFLYRGDTVEFPVTLMNTTEDKQSGTLTVTVNGERLPLPGQGRFKLEGGKSTVWWIPITVNTYIKSAQVTVKADWGKDRFEQSMSVPVIPDRPYVTEVRYREVPRGKTVDLVDTVKGMLAEHQETKITLVGAPAMSVMHHLKHLIRYPYGCAEQTASSLLPLVRMAPIVETVAPDIVKERDIAMRVRSGIARLISLQTPSGDFSFWPGGPGSGFTFDSIYVTFALLEAKNAGYPVPEAVLKLALNYINRYARTEAFGYYVLAEGGRLTPGDIGHILELRRRNLTAEELYFLAAALARAGRTATAREMLQEARKAREEAPMTFRYYYWTPIRAKAIAVYAQEIVRPGAPENEPDVLTLIRMLQEQRYSYYYSTQELAWASLALGLRMKNVKYARSPKGILRGDGQTIEGKPTETGVVWIIPRATSLKSLTVENTSDGSAYVIVENSGFKESGYRVYSEDGLQIEKAIVDQTGRTVQQFRHGETYFVRLLVWNNRYRTLENVAIEDFVPAGFEVDNPRLPDVVTARFASGSNFVPDYFDYRDQSVRIFGTLDGSEVYYYQVRAVLPGDYFMPPATAVAMYAPHIRAGSAPSRLHIARSTENKSTSRDKGQK